MLRIPPIVWGIVAVLLGIQLVLFWGGPELQLWAFYVFAFIPARISGSTPYPAVPGSEAWSFVSYALLHEGWGHLGANCLWLVVFGSFVARRLSPLRFLLVASLSAAGGAFTMLLLHWGADIILIGASGAVSGLMGAAMPLIYARHDTPLGLRQADLRGVRVKPPLDLLRDVRALGFTVLWFVATMLGAVGAAVPNSFSDSSQIAWEAHLGGFVAGVISFYLFDKPQRSSRL